ncbi:hypothetical protein [Mesorhizobium sp.]|uniref:hypothetical protein n=1 Tax=Mesorhizobium sp. TaxID=1871066 RepID=UPI000FE746CE|nr:hypothetical protein [Mesorhizobium sp.]RWO22190.1 MAG: hypothetical protein EOS09_21375 [Mesorhizobium sp.]
MTRPLRTIPVWKARRPIAAWRRGTRAGGGLPWSWSPLSLTWRRLRAEKAKPQSVAAPQAANGPVTHVTNIHAPERHDTLREVVNLVRFRKPTPPERILVPVISTVPESSRRSGHQTPHVATPQRPAPPPTYVTLSLTHRMRTVRTIDRLAPAAHRMSSILHPVTKELRTEIRVPARGMSSAASPTAGLLNAQHALRAPRRRPSGYVEGRAADLAPTRVVPESEAANPGKNMDVPGRVETVFTSRHSATKLRSRASARPVEAVQLDLRKGPIAARPPAEQEVGDARTPATRLEAHLVKQAPSQARTALTPRIETMAQLDASLVDRLANDIIHRIERRTRIERERRGL